MFRDTDLREWYIVWNFTEIPTVKYIDIVRNVLPFLVQIIDTHYWFDQCKSTGLFLKSNDMKGRSLKKDQSHLNKCVLFNKLNQFLLIKKI